MRGSRRKTVVLLIITAVLLAFSGVSLGLYRAGIENPVTKGVQYIFTPAQNVSLKLYNSVTGFFEDFRGARFYREENKRLSLEIEALKNEIRLTDSVRRENERLREALDFTKNTYTDALACEIIAKYENNRFYTFKLNKGKNDNISYGDIAVSGKALVGKVTEVGKNWSVVTIITSKNNPVGVSTARSGALGVAESDISLKEDELKLSFANEEEIKEGDFVETSGLGGVYPKGLIVGHVIEKRTDYAVIKAAVDFGNLREVIVVRMERE